MEGFVLYFTIQNLKNAHKKSDFLIETSPKNKLFCESFLILYCKIQYKTFKTIIKQIKRIKKIKKIKKRSQTFLPQGLSQIVSFYYLTN